MKTLPNNTSGKPMFMQHIIPIPACCPVSNNPLTDSTLMICYRAKVDVLEIAYLSGYIHRFVNGLQDDSSSIEVRDMEGLLIRVANDCAASLGVPVKVYARLHLKPTQRMNVIVRSQEVKA